MATFSYQGTQSAPQMAATQYNVQPNLSAAKAIEGVQQSILGAMKLAGQLKADVNQTNFEKAALEQRERQSQFSMATAEMGYEEKAKAFEDYAKVNSSLYDKNNAYGRKLFAAEQNFILSAQQQVQTQGIDERFYDNKRDVLNAFSAAQQELQTAAVEDRPALLAKFKAELVDPLEAFKDPKSLQLLDIANEKWNNLSEAVNGEQRLASDQKLVSEFLGSAQAFIDANGRLTPEEYNGLIEDKLAKTAAWATKGNAMRSQINADLLNMMVASAKEKMGDNPTYEQAEALRQSIIDFGSIAPNVKGTDAYKVASNAAAAVRTAIDRQGVADFNALVLDDNATTAQAKDKGKMLLDRKVISQEQYDLGMSKKQVVAKQKSVKDEAAAAVAANNPEKLSELVRQGFASQVATVVTGNLETQLATLAADPNIGATKAIEQTLAQVATYRDAGIPVAKLPAIDAILASGSNGGLGSNEDAISFVQTMRAAITHGYASPERKQSMKNFAVVQAMLKARVPDIPSALNAIRDNGIRVTDKEVRDAFDEAVDNESFARNLTDRNADKYYQAMAPGIRGLLKAGFSTDEAIDIFETMIESEYIEITPSSWPFNNRMLMPRVGKLDSASAYERLFKSSTFGTDVTIVPSDIYQPEGLWLVIDNTTNTVRQYPFEMMERISELKNVSKAEAEYNQKQGTTNE